jgi:hypothetical protein
MQRFVISWRDHAYRVSVPRLLSEGEHLEVVDAKSYDRLKQALVDIHGGFIPKTRIREVAERALNGAS